MTYWMTLKHIFKREIPTLLLFDACGIAASVGLYIYKSRRKKAGFENDVIFVDDDGEKDKPRDERVGGDYSNSEEPRFGSYVDLGKPSLEEVVVTVDKISYDKILNNKSYIPGKEESSLGSDEPDSAILVPIDPPIVNMDEGEYFIIGRRELNDLSAKMDIIKLTYFLSGELLAGDSIWTIQINEALQDTLEEYLQNNPSADEVFLKETGTDDDHLFVVDVHRGSYMEEVESHLDMMEVKNG